MSRIYFNPEHKKTLDDLLLPISIVRGGKMFGFPAYYVGKKLFASIYEDGVGLKLPAEQVSALLDGKTYIPFQPLGKHVMREWVQICHQDSAQYQADMDLFTVSIEFVAKNQT
jgi:hypothetical protein